MFLRGAIAILQILTLVSLASCSTMGFKGSNFPLTRPLGIPDLPPAHEMQIAVQIARDGAQEAYLLIVKTADNCFSMTFLSPQGLPVYRLTLDNKELRVSRQMHTGDLLDPVEILQYLELAHLPEDHISTQIGADWNTQTTDNKKIFTRLGTTTIDSESVTIEHTGKPPWYLSMTFHNTMNDTVTVLTTLEASTVLPE